MITACIISFLVGAMLMVCAIGVVSNCKEEEPRNKVRFYVARDKDKTLWVYLGKPIRFKNEEAFIASEHGCCISHSCGFENLGLKVDDYKNLKWEGEPAEVFLNLED